MPKRRERVAPPPAPSGWDIRYATSEAIKGWEKVCAAAPANARVAWERITTDTRRHNDRQHPLKGALGTCVVKGETFDQWQYEVTAGGRLWYGIDDTRRIVWLTVASTSHPKATD